MKSKSRSVSGESRENECVVVVWGGKEERENLQGRRRRVTVRNETGVWGPFSLSIGFSVLSRVDSFRDKGSGELGPCLGYCIVM